MEVPWHMNDLIDRCLYNWLGYGNLDGDLWFIGTEEGGAEIWREGIATLSLEESLIKRSGFPLNCDFKTVWEDIYGIPLNLFKGITTWHFMTAFILALVNKNVNSKTIKEFLFINKELGSTSGNHFMCELLPLPKRSKLESDFPYTSRWESSEKYVQEVIDKRFLMITDALEKSNGAKLIIVYDEKAQALIMDRWGKGIKDIVTFEYSNNGKRQQKYTLHFNKVGSNNLTFLFTPFFGQGQISYKGIEMAVEFLKRENMP